MQNYDVVTVGSATLDIFMKSDKFEVVKTPEAQGGIAICQVYGGKMEVEDVKMYSGGGATNVAVSLAKKELKTAVVCEMGNDPQALIIHKELEEARVETRFVVQEQAETTAVSVILIAEDGGRSIMVHRGASAMLTETDVPYQELATRWLHISSLGGNMKLLNKLTEWASRSGVRVSLNPGMKEIEKIDDLKKILSRVEVLFVNREEREAMGDEQLASKVVVVTDGENGGHLVLDGKTINFESKKARRVVDTTGAGDAFASGYIAAILYGHNYERALMWGVENARAILGSVGAKVGLLSLAEIKNF